MERLLTEEDVNPARRLARDMWQYWLTTGSAHVADAWLGQLVEVSKNDVGIETAELIGTAAEFPRFLGETDRAIEMKEQSLAMARDVEPGGWMEAAALHDLASLFARKGDIVRARQFASASLDIRRARGTVDGIAHALAGAADVEVCAGELRRAS
jgi:hypothetical protein